MNKLSKKYKKKFAIFLLTEFLTFALFGAFHIHRYDFTTEFISSQSNTNPLAQTDLSSDFFSYCSIHQFNHSVINYDKAKIKIQNLHYFGNFNFASDHNILIPTLESKLIPRAPPHSV